MTPAARLTRDAGDHARDRSDSNSGGIWRASVASIWFTPEPNEKTLPMPRNPCETTEWVPILRRVYGVLRNPWASARPLGVTVARSFAVRIWAFPSTARTSSTVTAREDGGSTTPSFSRRRWSALAF